MQVRTVKGAVKVKLLDVEIRRLHEAKAVLINLGRFTNAQVFDAAADGIGDAIAAVDKLNDGTPQLDA